MRKFDGKKILSTIAQIPKNTAFSFSMSMIVFLVLGSIFGKETMSIRMIIQLLALCVVAAILQMGAFTDIIIPKMSYVKRMCLFMFPFLTVIIAFAAVFGWFPMQSIGAWAIFLGIFALCFIVSLVIFEIHFKITGEKYTGLLNEYKKQKKNEEEDK